MLRFGALAAGIAIAVAVPGRVSAQETAGLGPHGVGFRLIEARDSTRAFRAKRDVDGERVAGDTARPVLVALWYPATHASDATRMTVEEFQAIEDVDRAFTSGESASGGAPTGEPRADAETSPGGDEARAPTPAVRDAPALAGKHPVVLVVGPAWAADPQTPAILASHGYVVAAVALHGRMTYATLEYTPNPLTLDTGVDDLGFVFALLRQEPIADTDRLALSTFSATSLDALLWHTRDMQADALVFVEGWERVRFGADLARASVHYDPLRVRVPVLLVEGQAPGSDPSFELVGDVVDSLAYADVTRVSFPTAAHGDFLSDPGFPGSDQRERVYAETLRIVLRFLEAHLREDPAARREVQELKAADDGFFAVRRVPGVRPAPSEEELFRLAEVDAEGLAATVRSIRERHPGRPPFREHVLVRAAQFARAPGDRIAITQVVLETYPASTAARLQLARGLAESGKASEARQVLEAARDQIAADPAVEPSARAGWLGRIEWALGNLQAE